MAANTLIPLKKPEGQLTTYTVKNPAIAKLEEKLKQLRHRYFNAKTRKDKLKYQKLDKDTLHWVKPGAKQGKGHPVFFWDAPNVIVEWLCTFTE